MKVDLMNEVLIDEFLSGNENAFNILARQWQQPIYNFCLRYLGDRELAKDLLQLTLMRVYKKLKTLEDHSKFSSWIYQIARNLCLDELKKNKGIKVTMEDAKPEIDSLAPTIEATNWIEREMTELLGINFKGHPDMRRLLLPDEWPEGIYPLRRDYKEWDETAVRDRGV